MTLIIVSSVSSPAFWEQNGLNSLSAWWLLVYKVFGQLLTGSERFLHLFVESWCSDVQLGEEIEHLTGMLKMLRESVLNLLLLLSLVLTVSSSSFLSSLATLGHSSPVVVDISGFLVDHNGHVVVLELILVTTSDLFFFGLFLLGLLLSFG